MMPSITGFAVMSFHTLPYVTSGCSSRYQGVANVPHQLDVSLLEAVISLITSLSEGDA
jgi:hypothetical protein